MIPKAEFFEWIENYSLGELTKEEILEFELELHNNNELQDEFKLHRDIQSAITEVDVLSLKQKLDDIAKEHKIGKKENGTFELLNEFSNIEEINENVSPEDLINFYDSLPKVHVYQHKLVSNENIHEFYREQNQSQFAEDDDSLSEDFDFIDMVGLEEAILEKDILNLRDTLSQVAKSVKPQFSTEDIEKFLSGELSGEVLDNFEIELERNNTLKHEVELFMDLDNALHETDIINLRSQISQIIETETSWNVSEHNIEKFIDGELESELLDEFLAELNENTDLMTEVSLRKNVNEAIGENDIFALREGLISARQSAENNEMKSIIPAAATKVTSDWKKYAAVAVILMGISGILQFGLNNSDRTYNSFYNSPEWAPERSVTTDVNILSEANNYYINGEYQKAIDLYNIAITSESDKYVFHFYKGASLQNMNKFDEAIPEYNKVISHGNNLFIEEAEWNKSLSYVKLGETEKAKEQLNAIINKNGFYKKDAKAVLRKIKYSLK